MSGNAKYDFETMVQVAKMYYQKDMNQQDIAKEFGWSRSMVSMILSEAKDCGIIEVRIHDLTSNDEELSSQLKERFGLQDCIVVPTSATSLPLLTKIVAGQAATFAQQHIRSHSIIGTAWGTTCQEFMLSFSNTNNLVDVNVVPLIGGSSRVGGEYQLNEMVRMFAEKVRGIPSFLYVPHQAETMEDKMLYMKSMYMQDILSKWENMDTVIISVGAPPEYYAGQAHSDPFELRERFIESPNRPVGDIIARRITYDGRFLDSDFDNRLIAADENALRSAKKVICAACGRHKVLSIIGALRMGIIHSFITDAETARVLIDLLDSEPTSV
ncbi:MAG: hypothetical protein IKU72_00905 [Oscillospiraceae bacterium]|nr:hypothetical protein [Oscillospiraceae bacterium]